MTIQGSATTADLHLREYIWASRPRLRGDTILAMQSFFSYCLENRLSAKLAGDVFHTLAVLPEHIKPLFNCFDAMREARLPVYYIQGNHDQNAVPWPDLHPWPTYVHKNIVELPESNMILAGHDAAPEDELREWLTKLDPSVNTLLLHQAEKTAMPFNPNFDLECVPSHVRTVLIGDIHAGQTYTNSKGTRLYYPGSPAVSDISQTEPRTFLEETPDVVGPQVEYVRIPGRTVARFDVRTAEELQAVEAAVTALAHVDDRPLGLEPLIRIVYAPELGDRCNQVFLPMRDTLGIYTWLDVLGAESTAADLRQNTSDGVARTGVMEQVIAENVDDQGIRDVLTRIYRDGDVAAVLTPELEAAL